MKRVLIKDIARKAGVSNATVSLVLNGKEREGRVSKKVSENVRKIALEMNYQPNTLARSLKSGKTQTIGLIVADITNPFFSHLAYYIEDEIEKSGYTVMIMNTNESDQRMEKVISMLTNRQIDGYIIVPTGNGKPFIQRLIDASLPVVSVDRYFSGLSSYNIILDGYNASLEATNLLISQGCRKIGLIIYESSQSHMEDRKSGFVDALEQADLYVPGYIRYVNFSNMEKDVSDAIHYILKEKVDGILFATNSISLWGIRTLCKLGIRISEDIRLVCFDKSDAFEFMPHPIPYIRQPIERMARQAVNLLLEQMDGRGGVPRTFKFPANLKK